MRHCSRKGRYTFRDCKASTCLKRSVSTSIRKFCGTKLRKVRGDKGWVVCHRIRPLRGGISTFVATRCARVKRRKRCVMSCSASRDAKLDVAQSQRAFGGHNSCLLHSCHPRNSCRGEAMQRGINVHAVSNHCHVVSRVICSSGDLWSRLPLFTLVSRIASAGRNRASCSKPAFGSNQYCTASGRSRKDFLLAARSRQAHRFAVECAPVELMVSRHGTASISAVASSRQ
jgi:hypothetical protein